MPVSLIALHVSSEASASPQTLSLTRKTAEQEALHHSERLKSFVELTHAAKEQEEARYALFFPRITFDAYYAYLSYVPQIQVTGSPYPFAFGANDNYVYGPTLTYTLWDTFATRKSYQGASKLAESRAQDRHREGLRLLLETRRDYVRVQEDLEELRAVYDSLNLSRSQNEYITKRFRSGGATRLDRVESERAILSYEIQFAQKQAELSSAIQDLLAHTQSQTVSDLSRPGPAGIPNISLEVNFDTLEKSLDDLKEFKILPPDELHPSIQSQELLAQSSELLAESVKAALYPTFQLKGGIMFQRPTGPILEQVNQNQVSVTASMPIFEMNRTRHLAQEKLREANSARYQKEQTRIDLRRDFEKAQEFLSSLRNQQKLAAQDVAKSAESALLYYEQYKGGKVNMIDVQAANHRALLSKVNKARIDAQILNQLDQLRALSGKEIP
jgi:outer membrane protein TolC